MPESPYDDLSYEHIPIAAMHADHLCTVAHLHGFHPGKKNVLELGCGTGAHLIPMAAAMPNGEFVGIDLSKRHISTARELAKRLGLQNIHFEWANVLDFRPTQRFDQILSHGVYSWVPAPVRDAILSIIRDHLADQGVAAISFSVLPGALVRQALSQMLLWNDDSTALPANRSRNASFFAANLSSLLADDAPLSSAIRRLVGQMGGMSDATVFHDLLAPINQPVTLTDFAAHAAAHELQFVADANVFSDFPTTLGASRLRQLRSQATDSLARLQLQDFAVQRSFRTAILCRQTVDIAHQFDGSSLEGLWISTSAEYRNFEGGNHHFKAPDRLAFTVPRSPLGNALIDLSRRVVPVPISDLDIADLDGLADLFRADHVALSTGRRGLAESGEVFAVAVDQARHGSDRVTSLWHRLVELPADLRQVVQSASTPDSRQQRELARLGLVHTPPES